MNLATCPFCDAKPKHGLGKVQYDQLHGDPFQRYRVWCPMGSGVSFEGSHARLEAADAQTTAGLWNQRPVLHAFPSEGFSYETDARINDDVLQLSINVIEKHANEDIGQYYRVLTIDIINALRELQQRRALEPAEKPLTFMELCELYNSAYRAGHHDTVEGRFTDYTHDEAVEHTEQVAEWLTERASLTKEVKP